jgi:Putative phage abortive infection protein
MNYLFPSSASSPASEPMQYYGLLGDYVGGFIGTVIGAVTLVVVFQTWRTARQADLKTKTYQVFAEMLRTHEEIVSSLRIGNLSGRDALEVVLAEFYYAYRVTRRLVRSYADWTVDQRIDIAFSITYYGLQLHTKQVLLRYDQAKVQAVLDFLTQTRIANEKLPKPKEKRKFPGHQNRLSHYFRNLYNAYKFIEHSELTTNEKDALTQVLRAKLSNYEQALLAINVISHLGRPWEDGGLFLRHWPIKNIPKYFFSFDKSFDLKARFPFIKFEWEGH